MNVTKLLNKFMNRNELITATASIEFNPPKTGDYPDWKWTPPDSGTTQKNIDTPDWEHIAFQFAQEKSRENFNDSILDKLTYVKSPLDIRSLTIDVDEFLRNNANKNNWTVEFERFGKLALTPKFRLINFDNDAYQSSLQKLCKTPWIDGSEPSAFLPFNIWLAMQWVFFAEKSTKFLLTSQQTTRLRQLAVLLTEQPEIPIDINDSSGMGKIQISPILSIPSPKTQRDELQLGIQVETEHGLQQIDFDDLLDTFGNAESGYISVTGKIDGKTLNRLIYLPTSQGRVLKALKNYAFDGLSTKSKLSQEKWKFFCENPIQALQSVLPHPLDPNTAAWLETSNWRNTIHKSGLPLERYKVGRKQLQNGQYEISIRDSLGNLVDQNHPDFLKKSQENKIEYDDRLLVLDDSIEQLIAETSDRQQNIISLVWTTLSKDSNPLETLKKSQFDISKIDWGLAVDIPLYLDENNDFIPVVATKDAANEIYQLISAKPLKDMTPDEFRILDEKLRPLLRTQEGKILSDHSLVEMNRNADEFCQNISILQTVSKRIIDMQSGRDKPESKSKNKNPLGLETQLRLKGDDNIKAHSNFFAAPQSKPELDVSKLIDQKIDELLNSTDNFSHQITAIKKIARMMISGRQSAGNNKHGFLLAHEMGLGKTLSIISALLILHDIEKHSNRKPLKTLIVVPAVLLESSSWIKSIAEGVDLGLIKNPDSVNQLNFLEVTQDWLIKNQSKVANVRKSMSCNGGILADKFAFTASRLFSPQPCKMAKKSEGKIIAITNPVDCIPNVIITSYDTFRSRETSFVLANWDAVIFDEAHLIKNPNSLVTRAAKKLISKCRIAVTGTPIENKVTDLWCLCDWVKPGGVSYQTFEKLYKAILSQQDKSIDLNLWPIEFLLSFPSESEAISIHDSMKAVHPTRNPDWIDDCTVDYLKSRKGLKVEVFPHKRIDFHPKVERLAQPPQFIKLEKELLASSFFPLASISKLKSLYSAPTFTYDNESFENPKVSWILNKLPPWISQGKRILLFVENRAMQHYLWRKIIANKDLAISIGLTSTDIDPKNPLVISGEQNPDARSKILADAQANWKLLILSPRLASAGLNLQQFDTIIHLTRMWNPSKEAQATARAWRQGQSKPVEVWVPCLTRPADKSGSKGFDESLCLLMEEKAKISSGLWSISPDVSETDICKSMGLTKTSAPMNMSQLNHIFESKDYFTDKAKMGYMFSAATQACLKHTSIQRFSGYIPVYTEGSGDQLIDVTLVSKFGGKSKVIQCKSYNDITPNNVESILKTLSKLHKTPITDCFVVVTKKAAIFLRESIPEFSKQILCFEDLMPVDAKLKWEEIDEIYSLNFQLNNQRLTAYDGI